jgi:hypothetical protein
MGNRGRPRSRDKQKPAMPAFALPLLRGERALYCIAEKPE